MSESNSLRVEVQEQPAWTRRLSITVPAGRVSRTRAAVRQQLAGRVKLPGFRKGHLPLKVIEQRFGPSIEQETLDRLLREAYSEALQSQELQPIAQGRIDNVQYAVDADLTFDVEVEVQPEIRLERTTGFVVERPRTEITDEDVDRVLERLREERALWRPLEEGSPTPGQQVTVELTNLDEEGSSPRPYRFVVGEGEAIPEVEEAIVSLGVGEEGDFEVRFPDDFPEEARRGESQRLHIRLTGRADREMPELDDAFAASVGDFETLEELRARVREDLIADTGRRAEAEVRGQLVSQIVEASPFELPPSMVARYLDHMTGHGREDGHEHSPEEEERISRMRELLLPQAEFALRRHLVVERLADDAGLRATQDDIDERVEALAEKHGVSPREAWLELERSGQLQALEAEITEDKVFEHLIASNTVRDT
jgi:trigger factor